MSKPQKIRKPYDPQVRVSKSFPNPSRTKQSFKDEVNIHNILDKYARGLLIQGNTPPRYDDFTNSTDYHSALNLIQEAEDSFASIPSTIRARFHNDPALFFDFYNDEKNLPELQEMGLVPPNPPQEASPDGSSKIKEKKPTPPEPPQEA